MTNVFDVAAYILSKKSPLTAMKLQKLVYYAQAWALVWDEKPLFKSRIEAWANGPVSPALYNIHRGKYQISKKGFSQGDAKALTKVQRDTVDAIITHYGEQTSQWLSELTHSERPWAEAREGLVPAQRGQEEITHAAMAEYYGSL